MPQHPSRLPPPPNREHGGRAAMTEPAWRPALDWLMVLAAVVAVVVLIPFTP